MAINGIKQPEPRRNIYKPTVFIIRFHKTILQEFYQLILRQKIYESVDQLQADLDIWVDSYNNEPTYQDKRCDDRMLMQTLLDGKLIWTENFMN